MIKKLLIKFKNFILKSYLLYLNIYLNILIKELKWLLKLKKLKIKIQNKINNWKKSYENYKKFKKDYKKLTWPLRKEIKKIFKSIKSYIWYIHKTSVYYHYFFELFLRLILIIFILDYVWIEFFKSTHILYTLLEEEPFEILFDLFINKSDNIDDDDNNEIIKEHIEFFSIVNLGLPWLITRIIDILFNLIFKIKIIFFYCILIIIPFIILQRWLFIKTFLNKQMYIQKRLITYLFFIFYFMYPIIFDICNIDIDDIFLNINMGESKLLNHLLSWILEPVKIDNSVKLINMTITSKIANLLFIFYYFLLIDNVINYKTYKKHWKYLFLIYIISSFYAKSFDPLFFFLKITKYTFFIFFIKIFLTNYWKKWRK